MPTSTRIASPERRWRAVAALVLAGGLGWVVSGSIRLGVRAGASPGLPAGVRVTVTLLAAAIGAWLAARIMRTHLAISDDGLADHRVFRVMRVPWQQITGFEVGRPGGPWGGLCISAVCRDGATVDLLSTRAYSRVPSARHLDELHEIRRTLEVVARQRAEPS